MEITEIKSKLTLAMVLHYYSLKPDKNLRLNCPFHEDLPSDKFGAEFGAKYFDPKSKQTFGEQLENYLNKVLKATDPKNAPNYEKLPTTEPEKPTRTNETTTPVYTKENK